MDSKLRNSFMNTSIRTIDESNYRITHTVNTKGLDRYDTIVLPKGARVENFLKNAVVLWSHNMDSSLPKIPIGKCVELNIEEDAVVVTTEFNSKDELAMRVFNAYKDGFLHAWSIGFIPTKYKKFDEENFEDLNKKYGVNVSKENIADASWGLYLIYEWELLEYSAVPVPGNPEALSADDTGSFKRELVTRGLLEKETAEGINFNAVLERECPEESEVKEDVKEDVKEEVEEVKEDKPEVEAEAEVKEEVKEVAEEEVEGEDKEVKEDVEEKEVEEEKEEVVDEDVDDDEEDKVVVKKEKEAEESEEEDVPEVEKESKEEVEKSEDNEKDEEDPEKISDPEDEVPEVKEESEAETEAMLEVAQREAEKKEQEDAQKVKFEELTEAVRNLTEKLEAVGTISEKIQELSEKVSKLEAKSSEVDSIKKDFRQIVEELGADNIDAIRKIESEKTSKEDKNSSDGFWHNLLLNR